MSKTWFITGATRGLGADIAAAALKAGDRVVATGRQRAAVSDRLGPDSDRLLSLSLDVTDAAQAQEAVAAALARFGTIDVLVNNAGYGYIGYFEEAAADDIQAQFATNVFGLFNVTRAALPALRAARRGHVFNLSSTAGIRGIGGGLAVLRHQVRGRGLLGIARARTGAVRHPRDHRRARPVPHRLPDARVAALRRAGESPTTTRAAPRCVPVSSNATASRPATRCAWPKRS